MKIDNPYAQSAHAAAVVLASTSLVLTEHVSAKRFLRLKCHRPCENHGLPDIFVVLTYFYWKRIAAAEKNNQNAVFQPDFIYFLDSNRVFQVW